MTCRTYITFTIAGILILSSIGLAIESGPSNTVGYWKFDVHPGFTQVSFPLLPDDKSLDVVIYDQLTGATTSQESDQILRWNRGAGEFDVAWFNTNTNSWAGDFSQLSEAMSYWIYVQDDHPQDQSIVAFGNVVEEPFYNMGQIVEGFNAIGSVWGYPASIENSGLDDFEGGMYLFESDLIMHYDAQSGAHSFAWKNNLDEWQGNLTEFEPLKGYWIYVAPGHSGFNWTLYPQPTPAGSESITTIPTYPMVDNIQSIKPPMPTINDVKRGGAKGGAR